MTMNAVQQLADQLRARKAANPSPLRRMIDTRPLHDWEREDPMVARKRTRKRRPTVASVMQKMQDAGFEVAGCKYERDGSFTVITGKPGDAPAPDNNDSDEWDGVLQ